MLTVLCHNFWLPELHIEEEQACARSKNQLHVVFVPLQELDLVYVLLDQPGPLQQIQTHFFLLDLKQLKKAHKTAADQCLVLLKRKQRKHEALRLNLEYLVRDIEHLDRLFFPGHEHELAELARAANFLSWDGLEDWDRRPFP